MAGEPAVGLSLKPYRVFMMNLIEALCYDDVPSVTFRHEEGRGLAVYVGRGAKVAWAEVEHDAATGDSPDEALMYAELLTKGLGPSVPAVRPARLKTVRLEGGPFNGQTREIDESLTEIYIDVQEVDLHATPPALRAGAHHYVRASGRGGGRQTFYHHGLLWAEPGAGNVRRRRD